MQLLGYRFIIIFMLLLPAFSNAQELIEKIPPPYIKTVQLVSGKQDSYVPLFQLGEKIFFSFDDLRGEMANYAYRIEHCDYNWKTSNLSTSEFLDGFQEDRFRNYENAFNTFQNYTHYSLVIPNRNMRIKLTGNYLISVIDDDGNTVFSKRFIVYKPMVTVETTVHRSRDIAYIDQKHDIEFTIHTGRLNLRDPAREINVAVLKNFDWNTLKVQIPPKYISGQKLMYNYLSGISFWAGNEFLYFDTKDIRNATNNISKTRLGDIFNTFLYIDQARYNRAYSFNPDINGYFVVRTLNSDDTALEADYSLVHFKLETDQHFGNRNVYVYGAFNDWKLTPENQLHLNEKTGLYEAAIPFKQGFYNYTYVTATPDLKIDEREIQGSYYQTENRYYVIVYYKQFGDRYTQVIGVGTANSRENLEN